ncbi:hypothetical protein MHU86_16773 [Fragilaria crotonensis]|nr:hypothetical protein MHU86_16773 [Fragilaria crotonensis]
MTVLVLLEALPYVRCFTVPSGDMNCSPSRKSGQSNFRNDGDDMPDIDLPQILQDTRSRRRTNTQEYRRTRYTNHRAKGSQNNTHALDHVQRGPTTQLLNQNSTISLKLSELSEWANQGKGDKAEAILMVLEEQGNAPRMAYLATIRAWLSRDRVSEALNVMARLEASQFKVKAADYRPILQSLIRNRQPDQAIRLQLAIFAYHQKDVIMIDMRSNSAVSFGQTNLRIVAILEQTRTFDLSNLTRKDRIDRRRYPFPLLLLEA